MQEIKRFRGLSTLQVLFETIHPLNFASKTFWKIILPPSPYVARIYSYFLLNYEN